MAKYLIKTVETYRCDTENEAKNFIESQKNGGQYTLSKYTSETKEVKEKGEVVDSYQLVSLTKVFDNAKDPMGSIDTIHYGDVEE